MARCHVTTCPERQQVAPPNFCIFAFLLGLCNVALQNRCILSFYILLRAMIFSLRHRYYLNSGDIIFWSDFVPSHAQFIFLHAGRSGAGKSQSTRHQALQGKDRCGHREPWETFTTQLLEVGLPSRPMVVTITMTRTSGHWKGLGGLVRWLQADTFVVSWFHWTATGRCNRPQNFDWSLNSNGPTNKVGLEIGPGFSVVAILKG